jgi:hypothetical protein
MLTLIHITTQMCNYFFYKEILTFRSGFKDLKSLFQNTQRTNNFKSANLHFSGYLCNIIITSSHQFARDVRFNLNFFARFAKLWRVYTFGHHAVVISRIKIRALVKRLNTYCFLSFPGKQTTYFITINNRNSFRMQL